MGHLNVSGFCFGGLGAACVPNSAVGSLVLPCFLIQTRYPAIPPPIRSSTTTPAIHGQRRLRRRTSEMNLSGMAAPDGSELPSPRYHQPVADVELLARQQAAVTASPHAALHVVAEAFQRALQHVRVELAEARYPWLRGGLQVALRAAQVSPGEAAPAVVRDRHVLDGRVAAEALDHGRDRRQALSVAHADLG